VRLRRKAPAKDDVWHLDELVVRIHGQKCKLWRAVDQDGYVLDEIVQKRRNTKVALLWSSKASGHAHG